MFENGQLQPWQTWLVAVGLAVPVLGCSSVPASDDYLEPELRSQVERLKAELRLESATAQNFQERAELLWRWSNAWARTGRPVPPDAPTTVMRAQRAEAMRSTPSDRILASIDGNLGELALLDEDPDALGRVRLESTEPLQAASWSTVRQVWEVGSRPMSAGGVLLLGAQIMADQGDLQHESPGRANYVSARTSDPAVRFEKIRIPLSGRHGGFKEPEPMVAFRLARGRLEEGDEVVLTYGDRSAGSPGFRVQTMSTENLLLPVYVDLDGSGRLMSPPWPALRVAGLSEIRSVAVFAPSVVGVGETFELALRSEDRYLNRAQGRAPAYRVLLEGEEVARIPAGGDPLTVLTGLRLEAPGVARFEVRSVGEDLEAWSNPVWVEARPRARVFWGELHGHSGYAEGQGEAREFFSYARDDARLDFVSLTDHDSSMDDWEWNLFQESSRRFTEEGRFIALLGYEWSSPRALGGHHNVFFRTPDRRRVPNQEAPELADLYAGLRRDNEPEDVLVIPHAHQAGDWTRNDGELERLVEISSMHGTFDWFGNLYLENGFEVGFISASDDHRSKPGYAPGLYFSPQVQGGGLAAAIAPAKTSDGIFDALRSLRAYATTGARILLDARLNGARMGSRQPQTERREVRCRVSGTAPIDRIELVKNGDVIYGRDYLSSPLRSDATVQVVFESSSEVFPPPRDNPRLYRVWSGSLEVEGARVVGISAPGLKNHYLEWARIDETDPQRILFYAETRGDSGTLVVQLEGADADTVFDVHLDAARENGFAPPLVRQPALLPAVDVRLRLGDLEAGRLEHELRVGPHVDRLSLQTIDPEAAWDRDFEYVDLESPEAGDYYYLRVTQLDGERAWSSPFWVGSRGTSVSAAR